MSNSSLNNKTVLRNSTVANIAQSDTNSQNTSSTVCNSTVAGTSSATSNSPAQNTSTPVYNSTAQNTSATILITTILAETSPQALPLGAACIASAIKNKIPEAQTQLEVFSLEDDFIVCAMKNAGTEIGKKLCSFFEHDFSTNDSEQDSSTVKQNTAIICFSLYMWNRPLLQAAAQYIREQKPEIILIAGGPEVTAQTGTFKERNLNNSSYGGLLDYFDYLVSGEGENSVPGLIKQIISASNTAGNISTDDRTKTNTTAASNISTDKSHFDAAVTTNTTNPTEERVTFNNRLIYSTQNSPEALSSPYLDRTIDPAKYGGALWELARGCPFKCSYCYESKGEKKVVYFPMERLKKELQLFNEKKIGQVFVLDPTYNADKNRALEMLSFIKKNASNIFFHFEIRAEYIEKATAKAFAEIPCSLQIGLQSAHEDVLKLVHRSFNKKEFSRKIALLNETGAVFGFDLIYGLPGDSLSGFKQSIDYAISLYPNHLELFKLSVLPGTDLYDRKDDLKLVAPNEPPYLIEETPTFSKKDLEIAAKLSEACTIFYSTGRAVSWFNSMIHPLKMQPSLFFAKFENWLNLHASEFNQKTNANTAKDKTNTPNPLNKNDLFNYTEFCSLPHSEIEKIQIQFVRYIYKEKHLEKLLPLAEDCILLNGALSRAYADNETSIILLNYHPDDVLSEYATDFNYFVQNAQKHKFQVKIFPTPDGPDYKIQK